MQTNEVGNRRRRRHPIRYRVALLAIALYPFTTNAQDTQPIEQVQAFQGQVDMTCAGHPICARAGYSALFTSTSDYIPPGGALGSAFWGLRGTQSGYEECAGESLDVGTSSQPAAIDTTFSTDGSYAIALPLPDDQNNSSVPGPCQIGYLPVLQLMVNGDHFSGADILNIGGCDEVSCAVTYDFWPLDALHIDQLVLNDIDETPLRFISLDEHPYSLGVTHVHGTTTITGQPGDRLALPAGFAIVLRAPSVSLESNLTAEGQAALSAAFGNGGGSLQVDASTDMFEIRPAPSTATQNLEVTIAGRAETLAGMKHLYSAGSVPLLVRYKGDNRYGERDEDQGGDDWVKPSVVPLLQHYSDRTLVGDISNMNGGQFLPHAGHRSGTDVDLKLTDGTYADGTAAVANQIIAMLNDLPFGSRILRTYVEFPANSPFWQAVQGVVLADGRMASAVIRNVPPHTTHFHWVIQE